jgi:hypothetical protein
LLVYLLLLHLANSFATVDILEPVLMVVKKNTVSR